MSRFARKERPPAGFEILEPTLNALESELRESELVLSLPSLTSTFDSGRKAPQTVVAVISSPVKQRTVAEEHFAMLLTLHSEVREGLIGLVILILILIYPSDKSVRCPKTHTGRELPWTFV